MTSLSPLKAILGRQIRQNTHLKIISYILECVQFLANLTRNWLIFLLNGKFGQKTTYQTVAARNRLM